MPAGARQCRPPAAHARPPAPARPQRCTADRHAHRPARTAAACPSAPRPAAWQRPGRAAAVRGAACATTLGAQRLAAIDLDQHGRGPHVVGPRQALQPIYQVGRHQHAVLPQLAAFPDGGQHAFSGADLHVQRNAQCANPLEHAFALRRMLRAVQRYQRDHTGEEDRCQHRQHEPPQFTSNGHAVDCSRGRAWRHRSGRAAINSQLPARGHALQSRGVPR